MTRREMARVNSLIAFCGCVLIIGGLGVLLGIGGVLLGLGLSLWLVACMPWQLLARLESE